MCWCANEGLVGDAAKPLWGFTWKPNASNLQNAWTMLLAMLRQCSGNASGNAQACRRLTVCQSCAGPMASMSRSCAAAVAGGGQR